MKRFDSMRVTLPSAESDVRITVRVDDSGTGQANVSYHHLMRAIKDLRSSGCCDTRVRDGDLIKDFTVTEWADEVSHLAVVIAGDMIARRVR